MAERGGRKGRKSSGHILYKCINRIIGLWRVWKLGPSYRYVRVGPMQRVTSKKIGKLHALIKYAGTGACMGMSMYLLRGNIYSIAVFVVSRAEIAGAG